MINFDFNASYDQVEKHYKREIEMHPGRESKMYISICIFMLLTFTGIGTRPLYDKYMEKLEYNRELVSYRNNLDERLASIPKLEYELLQAEPYMQEFNSIMPEDANIEDYLKSIVGAAGDAGYILTRLNAARNSRDGAINVTMSFRGGQGLGSVEKLAKNLEELDRITYLEKLSFLNNLKENTIDISVSLKVFSLESLEEAAL